LIGTRVQQVSSEMAVSELPKALTIAKDVQG